MIYPNINKTPEYRVTVPAMDGGVNTADGVAFVEDSQLTESSNLWWKDGALRTRPSVFAGDVKMPGSYKMGPQDTPVYEEHRSVSDTIYLKNGRIVRFTSIIMRYSESSKEFAVYTYMQDTLGNVISQGYLDYPSTNIYPKSTCIFSGKPTIGCGIYLMVSHGAAGDMYELSDITAYAYWRRIDREKYYVPLIMINGKGNRYAALPAGEVAKAAPASMLEGFNRLTEAFRASYTADNTSWSFDLPVSKISMDQPVQAVYTNHAGISYTFTVPAGKSESEPVRVEMLVSQYDTEDRTLLGGGSVWAEAEPWKASADYEGENFTPEYVQIHAEADRALGRIVFVRPVYYDSGGRYNVKGPARMGRGSANNICVTAYTKSSIADESVKSIEKTYKEFNQDYYKISSKMLADEDITVRLNNNSILYYNHTFTIPAGSDISTGNLPSVNNLKVKVNRNTSTLYFVYAPSDSAVKLSSVPYAGGFTELNVTAKVIEKNNSVFGMTKASWFGGQAGGLTKGSRLFLTGNESAPNLVQWSDLSNPLYFPENNYAYIGESAQPVTAFGKQNEMLVFFKPNEIYYTTYVVGESYSAEDILSGKLVDITAQSAVFPIYQIHPGIGCDCPGTIQLCDNRLVWAHSTGMVYTLVSAGPYSERNVSEISRMIERNLRKNELEEADSADWQGHYVIFTKGKDSPEGKAYLMDYASPGFQTIAAGGQYQTSHPVKWFEWTLPVPAGAIVTDGKNLAGTLCRQDADRFYSAYPCTPWIFADQLYFDKEKKLVSANPSAAGIKSYGMDFIPEPYSELNSDRYIKVQQTNSFTSGQNFRYGSVLVPIESKLRTKLFDFSKPERIKSVLSVYVGIGGNADYQMSYLTERGESYDLKRQRLFTDKDQYEPGYLQCAKMIPRAPRIRQFGIGIRAQGAIALDSLTIRYKILGV